MQLMTFNSLLMFDIVFVFFLFLVGVTCLVYYLPPSQHAIARYSRHDCKYMVDDEPEINSRNLNKLANAANSTSFEYQIEGDNGYAQTNSNPNPNKISQAWDRPYHHHQYWNRCLNKDPTKSHKFNTNKIKVHSTNSAPDVDLQFDMINEKSDSNGILVQRIAAELDNPPSFCYIKAKYREIKNITGPIQSV